MRGKIVIRRKGAYKTAKEATSSKKKKGWETIEKIRIEREVQILEKTNNGPMAISLESTVESCWVLDILFFSHSSTNWPEGLEGTQSIWHKSSLDISWKIKGNTPTGQFGRRSNSLSSTIGSCSFLDMWCT